MNEHLGQSKDNANPQRYHEKMLWEVLSKNQTATTLLSETQQRQTEGMSLQFNNLASVTAILAEFSTAKQ